MSLLLDNKNIVIMGLRNRWSITWGIAEAVKREGANVILTYQGEREQKNAAELAKELGACLLLQCDVSSDEDIDRLFDEIKKACGSIHGLVHGIAHANREDIQNDFINTSRDGFIHALNISAYSLVALARRAAEIMDDNGSIVTLTYMGSEKVFPGYNVMGVAKAALEASVRYLAHDLGKKNIRVNAISAGPIKTVSSKAIKDFGAILSVFEEKAPLRREVNQKEIGDTAVYLLSNLSGAVTGEVLHVDCGYNIMGI